MKSLIDNEHPDLQLVAVIQACTRAPREHGDGRDGDAGGLLAVRLVAQFLGPGKVGGGRSLSNWEQTSRKLLTA